MNDTAPTTSLPGGPSADAAGAPHQGGPRVTKNEVRDLARLRRTVSDRHISGVAGGIARHLDVDPILIRVGFVVASFFGGAGILLYLAGWILLPEEDTADQPLGLDERNRSIALVGVGVVALLSAVGSWITGTETWFLWPAAVICLAVVWFMRRGDRGAAPTARSSYDDSVATCAAAPAAESGGPVPPASYDPAAYARPPRRNPRKRGPILLWFTLALIALGIGTLGVIDAAGAPVVDSAYPALALAITTVMLAVGAFWGRAGGLILVGLVSALTLGLTMASTTWESDTITYAPTSASDVQEYYTMGAGELVVDLSGIRDLDDLDGRDLSVDVGAGRVEILVPEGVHVETTSDVGFGEARIFNRVASGPGHRLWDRHGAANDPAITLSIDLGLGEVIVREVQ